MKPSNKGRRQPFLKRVSRYLARRFTAQFGPGIDSVQKLTDTEFLNHFVFQAESPLADLDNDVNSLLSHYAKRTDSDWPAVPDVLTDLRIDLSAMSKDQIIERADRALAGDLHPSGVRPVFDQQGNIDWAVNPSSSREWLLMINRHAWWSLWAAAYQLTADDKYAEAFVSQLVNWIDRNPMPRQKSEHSESWRLMEAGLRMRVSWIPAFGVFFKSRQFDTVAKLKMLRALCDHGHFLSRYRTNRNHLVRESNGLIALALCFSEFGDADSWVHDGLQRLDEELRSQVNEDGSHIEMSVGYQWLTIDEFEVTQSILSRHDRHLPTADIDESLRRLYDFLAGVIRPDRSFPQLNDGFILWGADRLGNAAKRAGWSETLYAASAGEAGSKPNDASRSFPNAGLHVMRSGWDADALYFIFDTGPYGGPHGHEDKLSFELFAYGAPFIVDSGSYTYEKSDPFRKYFVGSAGHNTVMVDQMSQVRRWDDKHINPAVQNRVYGDWHSTKAIDFVSGRYEESYASFELTRPDDVTTVDDVVHQRDVVFVKPDYWIVVDRIEAAKRHDYDFLFHLAPDVIINKTGAHGAICQSERNGAQLCISAFSQQSLSCEQLTGSESPIQGWFSSDHYKKTPSPALVFRCGDAQSVCVAWLLYPLRSGDEADEIRTSMTENAESSRIDIQVSAQGRVDVISLSMDSPTHDDAQGSVDTGIQITRNGEKICSTGDIENES
jgi:hypothetical protein